MHCTQCQRCGFHGAGSLTSTDPDLRDIHQKREMALRQGVTDLPAVGLEMFGQKF